MPTTSINTNTVTLDLTGSNFVSGSTVIMSPVNANPLHKGSLSDGAAEGLYLIQVTFTFPEIMPM